MGGLFSGGGGRKKGSKEWEKNARSVSRTVSRLFCPLYAMILSLSCIQLEVDQMKERTREVGIGDGFVVRFYLEKKSKGEGYQQVHKC